jgi:response regulator RpfG family c-di-GMP phosphodiesterase
MKSENGQALLRVLLIENSLVDAELIRRELEHANGFELRFEHVVILKDVIAAVTHYSWDIILCDYKLDGYDAYRVIDLLEEMGLDIPFILLSGIVTEEEAQEAIRMGAAGYVNKDRLKQLVPVIKREIRLISAYDEILKAWTRALEFRDRETKTHSDRVVDLTVQLARKMNVPESQIIHIKRGALLHDIGKLGISDTILLKPGELTDEEYDRMKQHTEIGYMLLKGVAFLKHAIDIPHYHHEKWDGAGYPLGLQETEIPLAARIFAVVDVYDAMTSQRPYRRGMSRAFVMDYIKSRSGSDFDPAVVESFMGMFDAEDL